MAVSDKRVSNFDELTSVSDSDAVGIVDVSDTTQSSAGSTKKITFANLKAGVDRVRSIVAGDDIDVDSTDSENPIVSLENDIDIDSATLDYVNFDTSYSDGIVEGRLQWNAEDGTLEVGMPGGNVVGQILQEQLLRVANKSGGDLTNGQVVYVSGAQGSRPTIELAQADTEATSHTTIGILTEDIDNNASGYINTFGLVRDVNTDGFVAGTELWLSPTVAGAFTDTMPTPPNHRVRVGYVLNENLTEGVILFTKEIMANAVDILLEDADGHYEVDNVESALQEVGSLLGHFNGTFEEPFNALVTSDGATITMSMEKSGGGDLTMRFSDGETVLDCTPACTIELTAGTDTIPADNYIYIPVSTKVLTKSTTGFPTDEEHIKVAYFYVPSATYVQSEGVYVNQNWNDERAGTSGQGHMSHITEKIRYGLGVTYRTGLDLTETIVTNTGALDDAYIATSSGLILQLHGQTIPAKDMQTGSDAHVINDPTTPYKEIDNLNEITVDANGDSISGRYFNILIAMSANKSGEYAPYLINLPEGSYVSKEDAIIDVDGYNVNSLPDAFTKDSSTGIYLYRLTMRKTAVNGGTLSFENIADLRDSSGLGAGGSITPQTNFSDAQFGWFNVTDPTKTTSVDLSGITTGNNRTLTIQDADGTIALTSQLDDKVDVAGDTMTGDLAFQDDSGVSFSNDTGLKYNSNTGTLYSGAASNDYTELSIEKTFALYSNTAADGSGSYEPAIYLYEGGKMYLTNTTEGVSPNQILEINFPDGVTIDQGGLDVTGNIAVSGTVDGRDVATDGNKLDTIEENAEVNNISDINATDLTDTGDSALHYHSTDRARANHTGTQTASTISDFDTEVSNNIDVSANTSARHDAVTVSDTPEIDMSLTGQEVSASIVASSIDETKLDVSVNASLDLADSALQSIADDSITEPKLAMNDAPADGEIISWNGTGSYMEWVAAGSGSGDVVGPSSAVDNNIATFDGTTGKLIQDSGKALPTGDIVGTTDTQTLTDKTFGDGVLIDGSADEEQLVIQSHSTQTSPQIQIEDSAGTELAGFYSDSIRNCFFGKVAGRNNNITGTGAEGLYNSYFGNFAGQDQTTGFRNNGFGYNAMPNTTSGYENNAMGVNTLLDNTTGYQNNGMGYNALRGLTTGYRNTGVGGATLYSVATGYNNVAIGYFAGYTTTGYGNVYIGFEAGKTATGNNKLYINNADGTPLIYGEFDNQIVEITGDLDVSGALTGAAIDGDDNTITGFLNPGSIYSIYSPASCATATATTVYTFSDDDNNRGYFIFFNCGLNNDADGYSGSCIVTIDNGTAFLTNLQSGSNVTMSLSGMNLQMTQVSGITLTCKVYLTRMM